VDDEFEVEVTDLRTGQRVEQPAPVPTVVPQQQAGDEDDEALYADADAQPNMLPSMLPRWAQRLRATQLARQWTSPRARSALVALAAVLLVGVVVLASVPNSRATLGTLLRVPTPTPTATLDPLAGTFFAAQTVPWGQLRADGQPVQTIPTNIGPRSVSFSLPRGRHTLAYDAAPFPMLRCVVSVPADLHDTCPMADPSLIESQGVPAGERVLDMQAAFDRLPQDQQLALLKVAESAITDPTNMASGDAGDHYVAADGSVRVASEPFQATLVYTPNLDDNRATPNLPPQCVTLCDLNGGGPDQTAWTIEAHIIVSWLYTFADGQTVRGPGFASGFALMPSDTLVALDMTWNGSWHAQLVDQGGQLCGLTMQALANSGATVGTNSTSMRGGGDANQADGCFVGEDTTNSNGTPVAAEAQLLYRFGAVLAVNAQAHQEFPALPTANAHEQMLTQQMAQETSP
jgi:hypothetical protein